LLQAITCYNFLQTINTYTGLQSSATYVFLVLVAEDSSSSELGDGSDTGNLVPLVTVQP